MTGKWWLFYVPGDDDYWGSQEYIDGIRDTADSPRGWWTCNKKTAAGDRALIYATAPVSAIVAVVEALKKAQKKDNQFSSYPWVCDYRCLHVLDKPLTLAAMREDEKLRTVWYLIDKDFQSLFGAPRPVDPAVMKFLAHQRIPELEPFVA